MKRLQAMIASTVEVLGWPGVVGVAVLAFVVGFYFSAYHPERMRLDSLHDEAATLDVKRPQTGGEGPQLSGEKLASFYGFFPSSDRLADLLGKLYAEAGKESVKIEQGSYQAVRDTGGTLTKYQIAFPVKGTYAQVRKFVASALVGVPNLALESIQLERQNVGDPLVDAKVKMVLYLGQRP